MKTDVVVKLLNGTQLALAIGRSTAYVWAMKRAGFRFSHGNRTLLKPALLWLRLNPAFRMSDVYPSSAGERRVKIADAPPVLVPSHAAEGCTSADRPASCLAASDAQFRQTGKPIRT